jgi:hypothetical protein
VRIRTSPLEKNKIHAPLSKEDTRHIWQEGDESLKGDRTCNPKAREILNKDI